MILKALSFNVRGLNGTDSVRLLKSYITSIPQLDLLCLQEHKLRLAEVDNLKPYLWPNTKSWILEASAGYNNIGDNPGAGCGGIALFLASKWEKLVSQSGSIMGNRAQYIIFNGLPGGRLGFLNIYAPSNTTERTQLWGELINSLPTDCNWVLAGDFNFVESRSDKTNACSRLIPLTERLVFEALKAFLVVDEPTRSTNSQRFSWDNY